ncbi:MAG: hypothetical protein AAF871_11605 [Pseudomonadota bacterium]
MRIALTTGVIALGIALQGAAAEAGRLDRIEDRIDRAESIIDRQTDNGRLDRIEDRIDAAESVADRRGFDRPRRIDRVERRSWRRLWINAN